MTGGGTDRTSWGRSSIQIDLGERTPPSSDYDLRVVPSHGEGPNDVRTMLADFFSILIISHDIP